MSARGQTWTIASGASISTSPIKLESYDKLVGVKWPAGMTSSTFGFKVADDPSVDGAAAKTQQYEGADISLSVASGKSTNFNPNYLLGHVYVYLTVGSNEGGDRTVIPVITDLR